MATCLYRGTCPGIFSLLKLSEQYSYNPHVRLYVSRWSVKGDFWISLDNIYFFFNNKIFKFLENNTLLGWSLSTCQILVFRFLLYYLSSFEKCSVIFSFFILADFQLNNLITFRKSNNLNAPWLTEICQLFDISCYKQIPCKKLFRSYSVS